MRRSSAIDKKQRVLRDDYKANKYQDEVLMAIFIADDSQKGRKAVVEEVKMEVDEDDSQGGAAQANSFGAEDHSHHHRRHTFASASKMRSKAMRRSI